MLHRLKKAVFPTSKWIVSDFPPQCKTQREKQKTKNKKCCNGRHNSLRSVHSWYLCVSLPRFKNIAPSKLEMLKLQPSTLLHWQWKKNLGLSKCNIIQSTAARKLSCDKINWKVKAKQYLDRSQPSELYLCLARTNLQNLRLAKLQHEIPYALVKSSGTGVESSHFPRVQHKRWTITEAKHDSMAAR